MDNKKIKVCLTGYNDENERFLDQSCIFSISNWSEAKSKVGDIGGQLYYDVNE